MSRVTASTVKHRRQRYQSQGVVGLVDHRVDKKTPAFGRADARLVEAMRTAIGEATDASSRTAGYVLWRTEALLIEVHGPGVVAVPSRRSLYRLFGKLAHGLHVTGSARARRSMASQPSGPFSELPAGAPGELMQIDSTPLDVLVRLDDGTLTRANHPGQPRKLHVPRQGTYGNLSWLGQNLHRPQALRSHRRPAHLRRQPHRNRHHLLPAHSPANLTHGAPLQPKHRRPSPNRPASRFEQIVEMSRLIDDWRALLRWLSMGPLAPERLIRS